MNFNLLQWLLILSFFTPSVVRSHASHSSISLLGVSPNDEEYYSISSEIIKCKDGSKKFNLSQLNDDFCDCPDGSDEPGTSACPNGRFHCRNVGHMPLILFSSRVNDGICDCCDGSDEYDGKIKCPNTCWEAGNAARDKLKKKIATYQDGVTLRKKEIEQVKQAFVKDEVELSKLKDEEKILKGLVQQLKDRKDQIEKVEEEERLEKEKKEKLKKEAEKESDQEEKAVGEEEENGEENTDDTTHAVASDFDASIDQGDEQVDSKIEHGDSSDEVKEGSNFNAELNNEEEVTVASESANDPEYEHDTAGTENTEGLSKEELGRLVASRWTGEKNDQNTEGTVDAKEIGGAEETPKSEQEDDYNGYASELDEPGHHYDEPDSEDHTGDDSNEEDHGDSTSYKSDADEKSFDSDLTASRNPSWLEKIQNTVKSLLHSVNLFQTPMNISDAARVRKEYDESSGKLSKIESRISSLSEKLKLDFGPEKEFYSLHGHCFETKQKQYVYKVCPYKKATQEEGHRTTRLGSWEKFENSYKAMLFSNGDTCWNGPDRSLKVRLRCGLKNELTDIDEPSRCEYVALLSTPSVCHEEKLKELRRKLDALNVEPPRGHDEL